jgi:hypothetical protein
MEDPAGPVAGLKEIWPAAACAAEGWTTVKARAKPRPAATVTRYVFMDLSTAISPRIVMAARFAAGQVGAGWHMHDRKGHVLNLIRA